MPVLERLARFWMGRVRVRADAAALDPLKPAVVVSGGSRGLGLAIAHRFAAAGDTIVLVARDEERLARAATEIKARGEGATYAVALDVTEADSGLRLEQALATKGLYCDVLVNCAGVGVAGPFPEATPEQLQALLDLNVAALTRLTRHMLPGMLARCRGGILNVSSLGGAVPGPGQAAYYASKAYVLSLTEALAAECAGTGVRICVIAPGPLDTGFHRAMGAEGSPYRLLIPAVSLRRAAGAAYAGFAFGQKVIVPGIMNRLLYGAVRVLPHPVSVAFMKVLLRRPSK